MTASGDEPEMRSLAFPLQNGVDRLTSGVTFPRVPKVYNNTSEPTYALSVNNTNIIANGTNSATFTLTTTNVPDGTKIPYIITSKYRGEGKTVVVDPGVYGIYDSTNTHVLALTGTQLGDDNGEEKSHIINMSQAATTPTIQLNPNGNTAWTRAVHPETYVTGNAVPAAKTITLDVTASSASAYQFTGTDRRTVHSGAEDDPIIVVNYGDTIEFNINSGASHPFYLRDDTSGQNTDNIATGISSGSNGATSGTITLDTANLTIPGSTDLFGADTGAWLYYQCGSHSGMKGMIFVQPTQPLGTEHYMNYMSYSIVSKVDDLFYGGSSDDGQYIVPLGFNINIFGNQQDKIYLQCNQFITFDGTVAGATFVTTNQTSYARDKLLLGGGDRSLPYFELWWGGDPDLGTSYVIMDVRYPDNRYGYFSWGQSDYQLIVKQAEPDNVYLTVTRNDLRDVMHDMYPFYQDVILGGEESTGEFVVNNNQATLTITPSANFTNPDNETEVDVNMIEFLWNS